MKKILLALTILTLSACSTRMVNEKPQTFTEFVILNKNATSNNNVDSGTLFGATNSDMFPGLRLKKWLESEEVK